MKDIIGIYRAKRMKNTDPWRLEPSVSCYTPTVEPTLKTGNSFTRANSGINTKKLETVLRAPETQPTLKTGNSFTRTDSGINTKKLETVLRAPEAQPKLKTGNSFTRADKGINTQKQETVLRAPETQPTLKTGNSFTRADSGINTKKLETVLRAPEAQPKLKTGNSFTRADNGINTQKLETVLRAPEAQPKLKTGNSFTRADKGINTQKQETVLRAPETQLSYEMPVAICIPVCNEYPGFFETLDSLEKSASASTSDTANKQIAVFCVINNRASDKSEVIENNRYLLRILNYLEVVEPTPKKLDEVLGASKVQPTPKTLGTVLRAREAQSTPKKLDEVLGASKVQPTPKTGNSFTRTDSGINTKKLGEVLRVREAQLTPKNLDKVSCTPEAQSAVKNLDKVSCAPKTQPTPKKLETVLRAPEAQSAVKNLETVLHAPSTVERWPHLKLFVINCCTSGRELPEGQGVGLARKIAMDSALCFGAKVIACLDADTLVKDNYISVLLEFGKKNKGKIAATCTSFVHQKGCTAQIEEAIRAYEKFLHHHSESLKKCGTPFYHVALGPTIVCTAEAYCACNGMNPRVAGEDFYFLQSLEKVCLSNGGVTELDTCVYPSPRISDRVLFGTGTKLKGIIDRTDDATFYPDQVYLSIGNLITLVKTNIQDFCSISTGKSTPQSSIKMLQLNINDSKKMTSVLRSSTTIRLLQKKMQDEYPAFHEFLTAERFFDTWEKVLQHSSNDTKKLEDAFFAWFDGLKMIRFIHYLMH